MNWSCKIFGTLLFVKTSKQSHGENLSLVVSKRVENTWVAPDDGLAYLGRQFGPGKQQITTE